MGGREDNGVNLRTVNPRPCKTDRRNQGRALTFSPRLVCQRTFNGCHTCPNSLQEVLGRDALSNSSCLAEQAATQSKKMEALPVKSGSLGLRVRWIDAAIWCPVRYGGPASDVIYVSNGAVCTAGRKLHARGCVCMITHPEVCPRCSSNITLSQLRSTGDD